MHPGWTPLGELTELDILLTFPDAGGGRDWLPIHKNPTPPL